MTTTPIPAVTPDEAGAETGLRKGAIGFGSNVAMGVAATTPAGTIALYLGLLVLVAGVHSPAVVLVGFLPILLVAAAYYYLNRADTDCGTSFAWTTLALGPYVGWITGWVMLTASVIVVSNFGQLLGEFSLLFLGLDDAAGKLATVTALGAVLVVAMTVVAYRGIELSRRFQVLLVTVEILVLAGFAVIALVKVFNGDAPAGSVDPSLSWLNPFDVGGLDVMIAGLAVATLWFWGWEQAVTVNEESVASSRNPGRAGMVATAVLLGFYLLLAFATISFSGLDPLIEDPAAVLSTLGPAVLGDGFGVHLLYLAVLTSALAGAVANPMLGSRIIYSMARKGALPPALAAIHPRFRTPAPATIAFGIASVAYYVGMTIVSENILIDSIIALGVLVAGFYAMTGFTCVVYYRHVALRSLRHFVLVGVAPLVAGGLLAVVIVRQVLDLADPANSYSGESWVGVGAPLAIALGSVLLGLAVMVAVRGRAGGFFRLQRAAAPADALD
jgi:amino acid transporter